MYLYRLLLAIFVLGLLGLLAELLLLGHFEDLLQFIPLAVMVMGIVTALAWARRPSVAATRALQGVLVLFAVAGALGTFLHYRGNAEFEREMEPAIGGFALVREALMGATPALSPGTMILFAAIGLALIASRRAPDAGVEPDAG